MVNDNVPPISPHIAARRRLRTWAARQPKNVQNIAAVVCCQLRILSRNPQSAALRWAITQNLKRLRSSH